MGFFSSVRHIARAFACAFLLTSAFSGEAAGQDALTVTVVTTYSGTFYQVSAAPQLVVFNLSPSEPTTVQLPSDQGFSTSQTPCTSSNPTCPVIRIKDL